MSLAAILCAYAGGRQSPAEGFFLFPYWSSGSALTPAGAYPSIAGLPSMVLGTPGRLLLTVAGSLGGAELLARLARWWRRGDRAHPLIVFAIAQLPFLVVAPTVWDRYLLPLLPGTIYVAGGTATSAASAERKHWTLPRGLARAARLAGVALTAATLLLSAALLHDWLAWNSARWELGRRALTRHIAPLEIEGGMEWDGWFSPSERAWPRQWHDLFEDVLVRAGPARRLTLPTSRVWFPAVRGTYALSFSEIDGVPVRDAEAYTPWLGREPAAVLLLEAPRTRPPGRRP